VKKLLQFPFYFLLIALLPILRFFRTNWRAATLGDLGQSILVFLCGAIILLVIARLVWRDWSRGAVALAPLLAAIVLGNVFGSIAAAALVLAALVLGGLLFFFKPSLGPVSLVLNVTLSVIVALSVAGSARVILTSAYLETAPLFEQDIELSGDITTAPDIYYLIMDGLGQPRVLERVYGVPRSVTVEPLTRLGFQVMELSTVSYIQTSLSLSSTCNLAPVQELLAIDDPKSRDRRILGALFHDNRLVRALSGLGYRVETFPSGYPLTRLNEADQRHVAPGTPDFISYVLMSDGILPLIQPLLGNGPADVSFALRRRQLEYAFDHLPDVAKQDRDEPAFVFAHILAPHPPFVFGADGEAVESERTFTYSDGSHWMAHHEGSPEIYQQLYRDQATYLMGRLTETVAEILRVSRRPAVIIIQGDHGPGSMLDWEDPTKSAHFERFGIFNAWFVPGQGGATLPNPVPAINTFPVLLNAVFDENLPMGKDELWYTRWMEPYTFIPMNKRPTSSTN
jgi:hypothetical protein